MHQEFTYFRSPIGTIKISGNEDGIRSVIFTDENMETSNNIPEFFKPCLIQLEEYFKRTREKFNLKLNRGGTDFQNSVWNELEKIPFGKTRTYMEQTKCLGDIKAIRAVASANGKNPISIIIPCHRVIGSDGSLTGYAGGIWKKKWLLEHESPVRQTSLF